VTDGACGTYVVLILRKKKKAKADLGVDGMISRNS
jgi:hypothetical protein